MFRLSDADEFERWLEEIGSMVMHSDYDITAEITSNGILIRGILDEGPNIRRVVLYNEIFQANIDVVQFRIKEVEEELRTIEIERKINGSKDQEG